MGNHVSSDTRDDDDAKLEKDSSSPRLPQPFEPVVGRAPDASSLQRIESIEKSQLNSAKSSSFNTGAVLLTGAALVTAGAVYCATSQSNHENDLQKEDSVDFDQESNAATTTNDIQDKIPSDSTHTPDTSDTPDTPDTPGKTQNVDATPSNHQEHEPSDDDKVMQSVPLHAPVQSVPQVHAHQTSDRSVFDKIVNYQFLKWGYHNQVTKTTTTDEDGKVEQTTSATCGVHYQEGPVRAELNSKDDSFELKYSLNGVGEVHVDTNKGLGGSWDVSQEVYQDVKDKGFINQTTSINVSENPTGKEKTTTVNVDNDINNQKTAAALAIAGAAAGVVAVAPQAGRIAVPVLLAMQSVPVAASEKKIDSDADTPDSDNGVNGANGSGTSEDSEEPAAEQK